MVLDFGAHPDVVFSRAPLSLVICQVTFSPVLALRSLEGIAGFQEGLRRSYPQFFEVEGEPPVWTLSDEADEWRVAVSQDFVLLQTRRYRDTADFIERFRQVLWVLDNTISPSASRRIGFRKVNEIALPVPHDPASLVGLIRSELLGPLSAVPAPAAMQSVLEFADEDDLLVVRYGLGESSRQERAFILDCDYSTQRPYGVEDGALVQLLRDYSRAITSFFHWALEESFKEHLGPVQRRG